MTLRRSNAEEDYTTNVLLQQVDDAITAIDMPMPLVECGNENCRAHGEIVRRAQSRDAATKLILQMLKAIYERERRMESTFWSTLPGTLTGGAIPMALLMALYIIAKLIGVELPKL
jgi:hypothetical protein